MGGLGISEAERLCYELGETAISRRQARESIRRCLNQLRNQTTNAPAPAAAPGSSSTASPATDATRSQAPSSPAPSSGWQSYSTCLLRRQEVSAAEGRRLRALGPWMVASSRLDPAGAEYQAARKAYEEALSELERLLPPSLRGADPLIPTAVQKFMSCDPRAF